MSLIQEIKEQVLQGNQIAKAEALQLYGEHWRNYALRQTRSVTSFVEIDLIFVRSLMERAADVQKTVNIVHSQPVTIQKLKNIRCLQWRRSKSRRNTMKKEESCVIRS